MSLCLYRGVQLHGIPYEGTVLSDQPTPRMGVDLGWVDSSVYPLTESAIRGERWDTGECDRNLSGDESGRDGETIRDREQNIRCLFNALKFFLLGMTAACSLDYNFFSSLQPLLGQRNSTNFRAWEITFAVSVSYSYTNKMSKIYGTKCNLLIKTVLLRNVHVLIDVVASENTLF